MGDGLPRARELRGGDVIANRFKIVAKAAEGGMGAVYRAIDDHSKEQVALKVLTGSKERDIARFDRESNLLASLNHPRIVQYVCHGAVGDLHYLVEEWVEGATLRSRLEEGLSPDQAVKTLAVVASALAVSHASDVVHRDVKPSNLILRDGKLENITLVDFGIARASELVRLTATGIAIGTPGYMAPEQARGDLDVDGRADVFALGCILYECLVGRPAFGGEHNTAVCGKVLFAEPLAVAELWPEVPAALLALVNRLLAKNREKRPTAAELSGLLEGLGPIGSQVRPRQAGRESVTVTSSPLTAAERGESFLASVLVADVGECQEAALRLAAATDRFEVLGEAVIMVADFQPGDSFERVVADAEGIRAALGAVPVAISCARAKRTPLAAVNTAIDLGMKSLEVAQRLALFADAIESPIPADAIRLGGCASELAGQAGKPLMSGSDGDFLILESALKK